MWRSCLCGFCNLKNLIQQFEALKSLKSVLLVGVSTKLLRIKSLNINLAKNNWIGNEKYNEWWNENGIIYFYSFKVC